MNILNIRSHYKVCW